MSLDPMPDVATLLRMKAEREGRKAAPISYGLSKPPEDISQTCYAPVTLRLPWSALVSDNDKLRATMRGPKPIMRITDEYATAKTRIAAHATDVMMGRTPYACPLSLTARVWFPGQRTNDVTNWCKLVHDALNGIVYEDDRWLHDVRWIRAGVDVDAPRAELTIAPLTLHHEAA